MASVAHHSPPVTDLTCPACDGTRGIFGEPCDLCRGTGTTAERSYTTIDKTTWPRGKWDHEPDKLQWIDGATGLDCLIVRNPGGALCGYAGIPPEHPWHGTDYGDCIHDECPEGPDAIFCSHRVDGFVEVHGGLTYSASCQPSDDESRGICHVPAPGRPDNVWWFGFDCAHSGDLSPKWDADGLGWGTYKDVAYVRREVANLARQLAEVRR